MRSIKTKVTGLLYDSYIAVIRNSIGSNLFRDFFAEAKGVKKNIIRHGELSCAFFVSFILSAFNLINRIHTTVDGLISDLKASGWKKISQPKVGSIIVWEAIDFGQGDIHKHIGFYIGNFKAISNDYKLGCPKVHHWLYKEQGHIRQVEEIYWYNLLNK